MWFGDAIPAQCDSDHATAGFGESKLLHIQAWQGRKMGLGRLQTGAGVAALLALWTCPAAAAPSSYNEVCEASAAVALDSRHFVVASDDLEHLTLYERGNPAPRSTVSLAGTGGVTDIEGAALVGDIIFWLTSHSYNRDGQDRPKRRLLFATSIADGTPPSLAGRPFRDLRARVAARLGIEEGALGPALNIEGLAATPQGNLLLGLRGPLRNGRAAVVRIDDPASLVGLTPLRPVGPGDPVPPVTWLDLGGRGIRSIERVASGAHAYLIVAGPVGEPAGGDGPALFWWDGSSATASPGPALPSLGVIPEALIVWRDGTLQLLGDNEANCSDGESDAARPARFPSVDITP